MKLKNNNKNNKKYTKKIVYKINCTIYFIKKNTINANSFIKTINKKN